MSLAREIFEEMIALEGKKESESGFSQINKVRLYSVPPGEYGRNQGSGDQPDPEILGTLFEKPIAIESRHLDGKVVYLAANEEMAAEAEGGGLVGFTRGEITIMTDLERSMGKDEWILCLKAVCQTKKVFEGSRVIR
jgi:hypothetical protein